MQPPVPQPRLKPKDAATLILVDRTGAAPSLLMGRRRPDLAFLANKYVFPGGRVDASDRSAPSTDELAPAVLDKLLRAMRGRPSAARARALGHAAIRETREETGLALGPACAPTLSALTFLARAITPPGRIRRYDTRFFLADAEALTQRTLGGDGELLDLDWFTLPQVRALDLPGITRLIIEDLAHDLETGASGPRAVPFYYQRAGRTQCDLL